MLQNSFTSEYLTVKQVAELTGKSIATLKRYCKSNKYICRLITGKRGGNSGKQYEILVSSLEPELQEKIYQTQFFGGNDCCHNLNLNCCDAPVSLNKDLIGSNQTSSSNLHVITTAPVFLDNSLRNTSGSIVEKNNTPISLVPKAVPEKAKNLALAKVDLLNHWEAFRNGIKNKKQADTDFLELYNSKVLSLKLYTIVGKVSKASLYRWKKELKEHNGDYMSLIPNYKYGCESEIETSLTDREQKAILDLMLRPNKMSLGKAYSIIAYCFNRVGEQISSISSYRRFVDKYKRNNFDNWIHLREGRKALLDKVAPYIKRNAALLEVGDVLVADGNVLDFQVIDPFKGKPCRATLVVYMDWKSWDIAGYEIMLTENTQCIASALRNAIIKLGKTPKICYQDNGRAFRGTFFTGSNSFEECGFYGLFGKLGITPVFAKPYNGRAKIVERFFKEFTESFSKMMNSYVGNSIDNKPAYMKRNEEFHKKIHSGYIPTIEETKMYLDAWLEFHRSHICPNDKTKTIGEVFDAGKGEGVNLDLLDDLMMAEEIRTIQRNGIRMFNTWYYSNKLYGINDKVVVKYSLLDITKVRVYSQKGEFICSAEMIKEVHPMAEYLGDNNDVYSLHQALKTQKKAAELTMKKSKKVISSRLANQVQLIEQKQTKKLKDATPKKVYKIDCYSQITEPENKQYNIF